MEDLDFHDKQIINIFCNPLCDTMQIIIDYTPNTILCLYIKDICKIKQINLNCLTLLYESGGGLDGGYIEIKKERSIINLSGIIDDFSNTEIENNWCFEIEAKEITYKFLASTEAEIDKLEDKGFLDF